MHNSNTSQNYFHKDCPRHTDSRRSFLKKMAMLLGPLMVSLSGNKFLFGADKQLSPRKTRPVKTLHDLAVIKGNDIRKITRRAVDELGGIKKFVKKNDIVVIKPNIGWDRAPEYAANTNPELIAELVKMCLEAGAKRVNVFDRTCNEDRMCYLNSGIQQEVKKAGGRIYLVSDWKFIPGNFPRGSKMQNWPIYQDAVECDCFINVPIAKHHGLTGLTLSIKNLMGVCGGNRGQIHWNIDEKLADLAAFIKPDLTIIDAFRVLTAHGPVGGNLKDVALKKTVIAGIDPVLADSFAAKLMDRDPHDIGYIARSAELKLGSMDLNKAKIKTVQI